MFNFSEPAVLHFSPTCLFINLYLHTLESKQRQWLIYGRCAATLKWTTVQKVVYELRLLRGANSSLQKVRVRFVILFPSNAFLRKRKKSGSWFHARAAWKQNCARNTASWKHVCFLFCLRKDAVKACQSAQLPRTTQSQRMRRMMRSKSMRKVGEGGLNKSPEPPNPLHAWWNILSVGKRGGFHPGGYDPI